MNKKWKGRRKILALHFLGTQESSAKRKKISSRILWPLHGTYLDSSERKHKHQFAVVQFWTSWLIGSSPRKSYTHFQLFIFFMRFVPPREILPSCWPVCAHVNWCTHVSWILVRLDFGHNAVQTFAYVWIRPYIAVVYIVGYPSGFLESQFILTIVREWEAGGREAYQRTHSKTSAVFFSHKNKVCIYN